jgi:DNA-binding MarR family transcriptional regulator
MTKRGQSAFKEMRRREKGILNSLAKEFAVNELEQALKVLARLNDTLMRTREKGDQHD